MKKNIITLWALVLSLTSVYAQSSLYIGSNTQIYTAGSSVLTLNNCRLLVDGNTAIFSGDAHIRGNASNANAAIDATNGGGIYFQNLTIDKSSNDVQLNTSIDVEGTLSFVSGGIELTSSNSIVNLQSTGILQNETEANRIYGTGGYVLTFANLNAPTAVNAGNVGAELSSTENLGMTEIRRSHDAYTGAASSILRSYSITPTNNVGLNATLRFHYFDAELNGNDENTMMLWRSTDAGLSWTELENNTTRDISANWVQRTGIEAFSSWTSANPGFLPVEWLSFQAKAQDSEVQLLWTVAQEQNNAYFSVLRSVDNNVYEQIQTVNSIGNHADAHSYQATDTNPISGLSYYQIKQTDLDGKSSLSRIQTVFMDGNNSFAIYPNPNNGNFTLNLEGDSRTGEILLTNALGQVVYSEVLTDFVGKKELNLAGISQGVYALTLKEKGNKVTTMKVVVE